MMQEAEIAKVGRPKSEELVRQYYYYCKPSQRPAYETAIQAVNKQFGRKTKIK
jgi:hypothetical protein